MFDINHLKDNIDYLLMLKAALEELKATDTKLLKSCENQELFLGLLGMFERKKRSIANWTKEKILAIKMDDTTL